MYSERRKLYKTETVSNQPIYVEKVRGNLLVHCSISFCTPTLNTCEMAKIIIIMTKIVFIILGMVIRDRSPVQKSL